MTKQTLEIHARKPMKLTTLEFYGIKINVSPNLAITDELKQKLDAIAKARLTKPVVIAKRKAGDFYCQYAAPQDIEKTPDDCVSMVEINGVAGPVYRIPWNGLPPIGEDEISIGEVRRLRTETGYACLVGERLPGAINPDQLFVDFN